MLKELYSFEETVEMAKEVIATSKKRTAWCTVENGFVIYDNQGDVRNVGRGGMHAKVTSACIYATAKRFGLEITAEEFENMSKKGTYTVYSLNVKANKLKADDVAQFMSEVDKAVNKHFDDYFSSLTEEQKATKKAKRDAKRAERETKKAENK